MSTPEKPAGTDFIRAMIAEDLAAGKHHAVVTRFPPEPNGFPHIGHAKSMTLNFSLAQEFGGRCHLRFDDTNPETEDPKYVEAFRRDVAWMGFDWGDHLYFASDYFEQMYAWAEDLIRQGDAYVDSSTEEEIREARGTVTEPGRPTAWRDRSAEESLDLFRRMRAGEFPDGAHVLRARIDLASPNMIMRDPVLYRIRHATHYRRGDAWCIYPLYDYAHCLEDAIEHVTHSLCTLEFENNREIYDWLIEHTPVPSRPRQTEFARLEVDYTVLSKRKLLMLVNSGVVDGWDDPRMPTIAGMRRRGFTPQAIRSFCEMVGVTKTNSRVDIGKLEYAIREDLNTRAPRRMTVLRPLRVVLSNYPPDQVEEFELPDFPRDVDLPGSRRVPFSRELCIEREDFAEDPPKGFHRLVPGGEVRLRGAYIIRCEEVVKDAGGQVTELRCTYDAATRGGGAPDGRTIKGTLHWVSARHAVPCTVRLYDRLFSVPDPNAAAEEAGDFRSYLNPESLVSLPGALAEPALAGTPPGTHYQFERQGYFITDAEDSRPDRLVFNRTVTLKDTWARRTGRAEPSAGQARAAQRSGSARKAPDQRPPEARREKPAQRPRSAAQHARVAHFTSTHELAGSDAEILAREAEVAELYEAAVQAGGHAGAMANWVIHELPPIRGARAVADLPFGPAELAELVAMVEGGELSSTAGRQVLEEMGARGGRPTDIVQRLGLQQISDVATLSALVERVIAEHPDKVAGYRGGKTGLLGFFTGQVMRGSQGRANPELVQDLLRETLDG